MNERLEQTKAQALGVAKFAGTNLQFIGGVVKDTAKMGGNVVVKKTGGLKDKI